MKLYLSILSFFVSLLTWGQLITNVSQTPSSLVQNVLLGGGVTVSNIQYNGSPTAIGSFKAFNSNLGIAEGIVITTGTVFNNGEGPHGPNNKDNAGEDNGYPGSALLSAQLPENPPTFNASILEFDFVPFSDTVQFSYVFGSEEYPEYVGSKYNDVFGFFISGPGISGLQNIARVPGGAVVAINNVNNGNPTNGHPASNSQFYVSNNNGATIQYDGFTKVLTAKSIVQCGKTYHLRIAIADVGDGIYDSGIFLAANSLTSKTPVEITGSISYQAYSDPKAMAEGCVSGTVRLKRNKNLNQGLTIPVTVGGTATSGSDYSPGFPSNFTFNPGDTLIVFNFNALTDALTEGSETIDLEFGLVDPCGNSNNVKLQFKINDIAPVKVTLGDTLLQCLGDSVSLIPVASGGVGPYVYSWSTGESGPSIKVSPSSTSSYSVSVTDNCLFQTASTSATVTVPIHPPLSVSTSGDESVLCPFIQDTLQGFVSGGSGIYLYKWMENNNQIGSQISQVIIPSSTTTYTFIASDQCGKADTVDLIYTIVSPPLELEMSEDLTICPFDTAQITVAATGGFGAYYYYWPKTGDTTSSIIVNPSKNTFYTVQVSDNCQTFFVIDSVLIKVQKPLAGFEISSKTAMAGLPITFHNTTINGMNYVWDFGDGQNSTLIHPNNTFALPGTYEITLIASDQNGCLDTLIKGIQILEETYLYVPNSFTPDGDRFNNTFLISAIGITEFNMKIFDRWGHLVFETNTPKISWDGSDQNNRPVKQDVYTYVITYNTPYEIGTIKKGHVVLLR